MNIDQFRSDFPEFADYPASTIKFWSDVGEKLISKDRFGGLYDQALALFTAHNIVLAANNDRADAAGGLPGTATGVVENKSVGSVSVAYDNTQTVELDAGHWNQTTYGRQYIRLARMIGAGCYQL